MNGRERFMAALARKQPDRVPVWELIVDDPTRSAWGAADYLDFAEREDLDGVTVFENGIRMPLTAAEIRAFRLRGGHLPESGTLVERDEWGIIWATTPDGAGYPVGGPLESADAIAHYRPPDPRDPARLASMREAVRRFKGKRAIVFLTHDGFEWPHYLRGGMENLFLDWIEEPKRALEIAEMATDWKIALMRAAIREGADAVVSGDDYAAGSGPVMSPAHFRTFVLPFLKKSVEAAHDLGVPYIKHTDGKLWPIMDQLLEAGIDALDPIEPKAGMDIGDVKAKLGDRIALVGNIDCSRLLCSGTTTEVEEAVKETIAKAAPGGGYILASSNTIHPGVKPENYKAMTDAARRWGGYPLDARMVEAYRGRDYMARWRSVA